MKKSALRKNVGLGRKCKKGKDKKCLINYKMRFLQTQKNLKIHQNFEL